ncbi:MAG: hypothetical protein PVH38_04775 [Gammaproteobacteria bacterium]|jgi:hypothetical protein
MSAADTVRQVPAWVRWIAQDSSGAWWGYSAEPLPHDSGWYENEAGRYVLLGTGIPRDWLHSLRAVRFPHGVTTAVFLQDSGEIRYGEQRC